MTNEKFKDAFPQLQYYAETPTINPLQKPK